MEVRAMASSLKCGICTSALPPSRPRIRRMQLAKSGLSYMTSWQSLSHHSRLECLLLSNGTHKSHYRRRSHRALVRSSLLGVGAPEVLVIAVVALLVFGPKGLAELARSIGQSLRAFQPTIRELQSVSRDFKQTLEKEIGLDELNNTPARNDYNFVEDELTTQLKLAQKQQQQQQQEQEQAEVTPPPIAEAPAGEQEPPASPAGAQAEATTVNNVAKE